MCYGNDFDSGGDHYDGDDDDLEPTDAELQEIETEETTFDAEHFADYVDEEELQTDVPRPFQGSEY